MDLLYLSTIFNGFKFTWLHSFLCLYALLNAFIRGSCRSQGFIVCTCLSFQGLAYTPTPAYLLPSPNYLHFPGLHILLGPFTPSNRPTPRPAHLHPPWPTWSPPRSISGLTSLAAPCYQWTFKVGRGACLWHVASGRLQTGRPLRRSTWRIINRSRKSRQRVKTSCDNPVIIDMVVHRTLPAGRYRCCWLFSAILLAFVVNASRERDESQVVMSSPAVPR